MPNYELVEKIRNGSWKNPELQGADLSYADIPKAKLAQIDLQNADLEKISLIGADLTEANLKNAYFKEAVLVRAIFINSNLQNANLEHTNLSEAKLEKADLQGVDAKNVNLTKAELQNINLSGANLHHANLSASNLTNANLKGCNLQGANLQGTDLQGAEVDDQTLIELPSKFKILDNIIRRVNDPASSSNNVSDGIESGDEDAQFGNKDAQFSGPEIVRDQIKSEPAPTLYADPEDRIITPSSKHLTEKQLFLKQESLGKLEKLRDVLEKFRGNDEEFTIRPNTEEMPLSKDDLEVLKQTVNASIVLHKLPSFPPEIINALKELMSYLKSIARYLASIKIEKVAALVLLINESWELIEKLLPMLG